MIYNHDYTELLVVFKRQVLVSAINYDVYIIIFKITKNLIIIILISINVTITWYYHSIKKLIETNKISFSNDMFDKLLK